MVKKWVDKASDLKKDTSLIELLSSSGFVLFFKVLGAVSGYIFAFVVSKHGADAYGIYELSFTALMILAVVVKLGLDGATVRFTQEYLAAGHSGKIRPLIKKSVLTISLLAIAVGGFFYLLRVPIAAWFDEPGLESAYKWVALGLLPFVLLQFFAEALRALKNMKAYAVLQVGTVLIIAAGLFIAFQDSILPKGELATLSFVAATFVLASVGILIYRWSYQKRIGTVANENIDFKGIIKVGIPLLVSGSLFLVISWTDTLMIGYFKTSADVGVYRIAFKIATLITFIQFAVNSIAAPNIASLYANNNMEGLRKYTRQIGVVNALFAIPIFILIIAFPETLLNLFGAEYSSGKLLLPVLALGQLINALCGPVMYILNMTGKEQESQRIMLWMSVINIVLNLVLIPAYGIIGAAIATSISMIAWNVIAAVLVYRYYKVIAIPFFK